MFLSFRKQFQSSIEKSSKGKISKTHVSCNDFLIDFASILGYILINDGPLAQHGRAPQWHCGGHRFEPGTVHKRTIT